MKTSIKPKSLGLLKSFYIVLNDAGSLDLINLNKEDYYNL